MKEYNKIIVLYIVIVLADMKKYRLEWTGHVVRMDRGRRVTKIFESKLEGSRRWRRPRLRWLEDVEKDLRERQVKSLCQKAVDRQDWEVVINL
jgi:hypothetical protein